MKKHNIAISVISIAVMLLLCSCSSKQKKNTTEQVTQSKEDETIIIANEKNIFGFLFSKPAHL